MSGVRFPPGFHLERLARTHPRKQFSSGQPQVDDWLTTKALQNQEKHLSVTKVLIDESGVIAGYYSLATGQVDFSDLPPEEAKSLPRRLLPVALLAWLGVATDHQGRGLGRSLLAQSLRDCYEAGQTFAFIAVVIECIDQNAKAFYLHYDFEEMPGYSQRLFLSSKRLAAMMTGA